VVSGLLTWITFLTVPTFADLQLIIIFIVLMVCGISFGKCK
jgi:hypothetical protein